jgi:hypothetical protein
VERFVVSAGHGRKEAKAVTNPRRHLWSLCSGILLAGLAARATPAEDKKPEDPCATRGTSIFVRTSEHKMWLCREGATDVSYTVALGAGGIGKRTKRDNKVPLGVYKLGKPRTSSRFHRFIPIGYPTEAQRRAGYTGTDLGIHGPDPMFSWEGTVDWTNGCVAFKTNDEIDAVATWTKSWQPSHIEIVP